MPAVYAHYRFGKQLISTLPPDVKQCVSRFRRLYDTGLQGPDLFFYYNPLMKTSTGALGKQFHNQSGQEFFTRVCAQTDTEAARAYLYGLLAHYCLDTACHGFVEKMASQGNARHIQLESEFDRYLMEIDGLPQPYMQDHSKRIKLTRGECVTVSGFYPPAAPGQINQCIRVTGWVLRFFAGKNRKRTVGLMKRFAPGYLDNLIPEKAVEGFDRMDSELLARFNRAQKHYLVLLDQIQAHMQEGTPLGEDFTPNFVSEV